MRNCVDCDAATVVVPVNCSRLLCKLVVVQFGVLGSEHKLFSLNRILIVKKDSFLNVKSFSLFNLLVPTSST